ncbi:glucokinase [Mesobacterium sp. TK19101]|uniref:Glucokinase n=1 Tax=Mesobacterium hydrothermale TaxID=3111907 RepID=A0ABU6HFA5_9RHOB|nr:glucokinase [Mesobacterium sp. TK19101]MEC3861149.1 glucokinase [Mesobacterium sp. TK19101]
MAAMTAVVADIGGTNTRVALTHGTTVRTDTIARFRNADHADLSSVLKTYLSDRSETVDAACVAMAGPVHDGVGTLTNLDWTIDRSVIAAATGAGTVAVLNDLQAQGHAIAHLPDDKLDVVFGGPTSGDHAARLVLGVGTGLNAALVYRTERGTLVPPSESGHISLPVQNEEELRLMTFLGRKHGTPGFEEALSGRGVENLYAWACHEAGTLPPGFSAHQVMLAVAEGSDEAAQRAAHVFVRLLGRLAGNLALIQLPYGGIYLCGGVARAFGPYYEAMGFAQSFLDKGRFADFMRQFAVYVVNDDYAALTGSAWHLQELIETA